MYLGLGRRARGASATASATTDTRSARRMRRRSASAREVRRTGGVTLIASTQGHHSMEGRAIVRAATLEEYQEEPGLRAAHGRGSAGQDVTLYDLTASSASARGGARAHDLRVGHGDRSEVCTGCTACVVACYAENNIPVDRQGAGAARPRDAWIRIDRYFEGDAENPAIYHQPMLCQQCENAPCEVVCPVAATTHSSEGLNDMVYNRCVGTRYCSNNCPYKVRRFNFLLYSDWDTTVPTSCSATRTSRCAAAASWRSAPIACSASTARGRTRRSKAGRSPDGEIKTACQQACPTDAIVFGNINDPDSRVSQLKAESTQLRRARRVEHASAHDVPRRR